MLGIGYIKYKKWGLYQRDKNPKYKRNTNPIKYSTDEKFSQPCGLLTIINDMSVHLELIVQYKSNTSMC